MHKKHGNKIRVLGAVVVLIGVGVWAFRYSPFIKGSTTTSELGGGISTTRPSNSVSEVVVSEIADMSETDFTEVYQNKKYRLSFKYPEGYTVTSIPDPETGGDMILVQKQGGKSGIQIVLSPFDEPSAVLTPNRVEQEAGITIESPQDVLIGSRGKGLAFIGKNTNFGTSREVWFVFGTTLYQMSTYIELDVLLKNVLSTWQFN